MLLAGCAGLPTYFKDPDLKLQRVVVRGVGLTGGTMDLIVGVYNPNSFDLHGHPAAGGPRRRGFARRRRRIHQRLPGAEGRHDRWSPCRCSSTGTGSPVRSGARWATASCPYKLTGQLTVETPVRRPQDRRSLARAARRSPASVACLPHPPASDAGRGVPIRSLIQVRDPIEKAVLVAAPRKGSKDARHVTEHLEELTRLVDTAGAEVVGRDLAADHLAQSGHADRGREGRGGGGGGGRVGRHAGHLRRRAEPGAGRQPRARAQGAGDGPGRGHPRHLLDPRPEPRGQAAGRAGAARVPAAAAHPDVDPPLPYPRRHRPPGPGRNPAGDRPPDHPPADPGPQGEAPGRRAPPREPARRAATRC